MLLAQFIGIVHEIMPVMLKKKTIISDEDFPPSLISLGYLKGTSSNILNGLSKRNYKICVIPNFDLHLSQMKNGKYDNSPFVTISTVV